MALTAPTQHSHNFWKEQCAATAAVRVKFGVQKALEYLIGEKFLNFVQAAKVDSEAGVLLPRFAAAVCKLFTAGEINEYLGQLQRRRIITRHEEKPKPYSVHRRLTRSDLERLLLRS